MQKRRANSSGVTDTSDTLTKESLVEKVTFV